jgi:hypothetical protein
LDSGFRIQDSGCSDPKTINLTFNYAVSYLNPASRSRILIFTAPTVFDADNRQQCKDIRQQGRYLAA